MPRPKGDATLPEAPLSDAERRDAARTVAIGEPAGSANRADDAVVQPFHVRRSLRGVVDAGVVVQARVTGPVEGTALLLEAASARWEALAADETLLASSVGVPRGKCG